ncbi:MAG: TlpA family protein disulfide reductase [Sulfurovaceae bacterium]|nr:TlpA family protein disulfide reductase [Sulfurovaceae bacterium]
MKEERRKKQKYLLWGIFFTIIVSTMSALTVYVYMLKNSIVDIDFQILKVKYHIENIDVTKEEENQTIVILNKKLEELVKIKKEEEAILSELGLLENDIFCDDIELLEEVIVTEKNQTSDNRVEIKEKIEEPIIPININLEEKETETKTIVKRQEIEVLNINKTQSKIIVVEQKETSTKLVLLAVEAEEKGKTFTLTNMEETEIHVSHTESGLYFQEYYGKAIFLVLFGHRCPPCNAEIPEFIELTKKYKDKLEIVAIEAQSYSVEKLKVFREEKDINYNLIAGKEHDEFLGYIAQRAEWSGKIPFLIALDRYGMVQEMIAGFVSKEKLEELVKRLTRDSGFGEN